MLPFNDRNEHGNEDMERALDQFADVDWRKRAASGGKAAASSPVRKPAGSLQGERCEQERGTGKQADDPAKPRKSTTDKSRTVAPTAWSVKPYTTKRGVTGKLIKVGLWSAFIREGQEQHVIDSINQVFRMTVAGSLVAAIRGAPATTDSDS